MDRQIEVLLGAKELVMKSWSKGAFARDVRGRPVPVMSDEAVSFDALGAIVRSAGGMNEDYELASGVYCECIDGSPNDWQDESSLLEILACFNESIATLRARSH